LPVALRLVQNHFDALPHDKATHGIYPVRYTGAKTHHWTGAVSWVRIERFLFRVSKPGAERVLYAFFAVAVVLNLVGFAFCFNYLFLP
jgi:hypothetical protein